MSWFSILKTNEKDVEDWDSEGKPAKDDDEIECPTCRGQGFRDAWSGDPEHDGETCYHCWGHGTIRRDEKDNASIDDVMQNLKDKPNPETKQAFLDHFKRQRERLLQEHRESEEE